MSNVHLSDQNLSLKAKGLLSMILSLPDDWYYSIRGLAKISKESPDSIGSGLKELEAADYLTRRQLFMNIGYLQKIGMSVKGSNYRQVYSGEMKGNASTAKTLESIYERFNLHHPDDFRGHSLSVSDVVVLREDGRADGR